MAGGVMARVQNWLTNRRKREEGQGLVEYVILIGLIALAVFAAVIFFEDEISKTFSGIGNRISSLP